MSTEAHWGRVPEHAHNCILQIPFTSNMPIPRYIDISLKPYDDSLASQTPEAGSRDYYDDASSALHGQPHGKTACQSPICKVRQKKNFLEGYSSFVGKDTRAWSEAQRVVLLYSCRDQLFGACNSVYEPKNSESRCMHGNLGFSVRP